MKNMQVNSSAIRSVGYNTNNTLEVTFHSGNRYFYFDVPQDTVEQMLGAESIGQYYNWNVSGKYRRRRASKV